MEPGLMVLSIYCAHMATKWDRLLELRPRQGKDMSVQAYYDEFCIWKEKMEEQNYFADEQSYVDDFLCWLKWDLIVRVWSYKSKPHKLSDALQRARFEESMMKIEAYFHTPVEENEAADSNMILVEEISIQDVGGVANENGVNEGDKEDFSDVIDEGHLQILQMEAKEGKVFDEMPSRTSVESQMVIKDDYVDEAKEKGELELTLVEGRLNQEKIDHIGKSDNSAHYVFDILPKSGPTAFPSFSPIQLSPTKPSLEQTRERDEDDPVGTVLHECKLLGNKMGQPPLSKMRSSEAVRKLFDEMSKHFSAKQKVGVEGLLCFSLADFTRDLGSKADEIKVASAFSSSKMMFGEMAVFMFDPGISSWFYCGCDAFEFTNGVAQVFDPGIGATINISAKTGLLSTEGCFFISLFGNEVISSPFEGGTWLAYASCDMLDKMLKPSFVCLSLVCLCLLKMLGCDFIVSNGVKQGSIVKLWVGLEDTYANVSSLLDNMLAMGLILRRKTVIYRTELVAVERKCKISRVLTNDFEISDECSYLLTTVLGLDKVDKDVLGLDKVDKDVLGLDKVDKDYLATVLYSLYGEKPKEADVPFLLFFKVDVELWAGDNWGFGLGEMTFFSCCIGVKDCSLIVNVERFVWDPDVFSVLVHILGDKDVFERMEKWLIPTDITWMMQVVIKDVQNVYNSKKLINDPNDVVTEFIEGLVETYPGLQYLDGFPEIKVVLRADVSAASYDKVSVISGGGSGHEPAHGGFVGEGMLTAAVCGDVFASPPVASILAGIRAVTGPMGCLLIVKNYTGDRLNFGLAAEQAKSEGYKVEMVIVGDDCALPPPRGIAGRRGLAGTIFVHKVAGAAAACGLPLNDVTAEAKHAAEMIGTVGVALSVCTLPGRVTSDRLGPGKMELGLGIHGEPGAAVADLQSVDVIVSHVLSQILSPETGYVPIKRGSRVALMVNGLGGTPLMELMIAAGKAVPKLQLEHGLAVDRVYTGSFMTSIDMAGFSISIMKTDGPILSRLDAPTKAPSWPVGVDGDHPPAKIPVPVPPSVSTKSYETPSRPNQLTPQGQILEVAIEAAATAVIHLKDNLNEWDSKVGDGDCGSTMCKGATAILEDMQKYYPLNDTSETVNEIGVSIRRVMGGTIGIIYDIFCKAAYAWLKANSKSDIEPLHWAGALEAAIVAVSKYGGAYAGYRTLLDALIPASSVLKEKLAAGNNPVDAFVLSAEAAATGAESTKSMPAQAGRSMYVSAEILATVPDPGAMAAASWYKAAALAVKHNFNNTTS